MEYLKNLNRLITNNQFDSVIKSHPAKKSLELDGFATEFYQSFKKTITNASQNTPHS
jgi:hypothetical protein